MARSIVPFPLGSNTEIYPVLQIQRLFDDMLRGFAPPATAGGNLAMTPPRIDVSETDQQLIVRAEMPGVGEDDFSVELDGDVLTIRGEKKIENEERDERRHIVERAFGSFMRAIQLPFAPKPDQIGASFENGVLTVTIPKSAGQQGSHRIQVGRGKTDGGAAAPTIDRAAAGDKPGQSTASAQSDQKQSDQKQQQAGAQSDQKQQQAGASSSSS
ncbi:MAG: type effector protein [Rhodospirillales bacterium]|nr:type effector protein [Rhodospirillales bacterium]